MVASRRRTLQPVLDHIRFIRALIAGRAFCQGADAFRPDVADAHPGGLARLWRQAGSTSVDDPR